MTTFGEMKEAAAGRMGTLMEATRAIDATLETVPVADIVLTIDRDNVEMAMDVKGERAGVLTPRATKNVSRLTRASVPLMFNQSDPTLNAVFQRQLAELNTVSILRDPANFNNIISVFRTDTYQPYDKLIESIAGDVVRFSGDVMESDAMTFMTGVGEMSDSIVYGMNLTLSANGMARSQYSSGLFRLLCSNGAINKVHTSATIKEAAPAVVVALSREFAMKQESYVADVEELLEFMRNTKLVQQQHWHLLDGYKLNKLVVDRYKETVNIPDSNRDTIEGAKAGGVETLYDSFNILTHLAKDVELPSAKAKIETSALSWAADIMAMSVSA